MSRVRVPSPTLPTDADRTRSDASNPCDFRVFHFTPTPSTIINPSATTTGSTRAPVRPMAAPLRTIVLLPATVALSTRTSPAPSNGSHSGPSSTYADRSLGVAFGDSIFISLPANLPTLRHITSIFRSAVNSKRVFAVFVHRPASSPPIVLANDSQLIGGNGSKTGQLIADSLTICGRFTLFAELKAVATMFGISEPTFDCEPRYNIAPAQPASRVASTLAKPASWHTCGGD